LILPLPEIEAVISALSCRTGKYVKENTVSFPWSEDSAFFDEADYQKYYGKTNPEDGTQFKL